MYRSNSSSSSKSIVLCLPRDMRVMIVMMGMGMGMIRGGVRGLVRRCRPALGMNDDGTSADMNFLLSVLRYG